MVPILVSLRKVSLFHSLKLLPQSLSGICGQENYLLFTPEFKIRNIFAPPSFKEIFIISSLIKLLLFNRNLFGFNIVSKVNITSVLNGPVVEEKCFRVCD